MSDKNTQSTHEEAKSLKLLTGPAVYLVSAIGLAATLFYLYHYLTDRSHLVVVDGKEEMVSAYDMLDFNAMSPDWPLWICLALLMVIARDIGYIIRIRILTEGKLTWKSCARVIFVWEFASTITPGSVGGSAVATFILMRERLSAAYSATNILTSSILDQLFYTVFAPFILFFLADKMFDDSTLLEGSSFTLKQVFITGYAIMALLAFALLSLLFSPKVRNVFASLFKLPVLNRWQLQATSFFDEMTTSSEALKKKSIPFWLKAFSATCFAWFSRFMLINFLLAAFVPATLGTHLLVFGRQLVLWIIMLVSPTPGGSGIAEYGFIEYIIPFIPIGFGIVVMVLWRFLVFYIYMLIGAALVPAWIKMTARTDSQ